MRDPFAMRRVTVRLSDDLDAELRLEARRLGVSMAPGGRCRIRAEAVKAAAAPSGSLDGRPMATSLERFGARQCPLPWREGQQTWPRHRMGSGCRERRRSTH